MSFEDAVKLFGFTTQFDEKQVKARYRELVKKWHPDINKSANANDMMQQINLAYDILRENVGRSVVSEAAEYKHAGNIFDIVRAVSNIKASVSCEFKHRTLFDIYRVARKV